MSKREKLELGSIIFLIALAISIMVSMLILTSAYAGNETDFATKSCHQVIADSREAGEANQANWKWVAEYLSAAGITKASPRYSHQSIVVHCIVFKKDTLLDGVKVLITELYAETLI